MTALEKCEIVRAALEDKKAEDIRVIDVRGKSSITDAIVVASASAAPHLRALSVGVQRELSEKLGEHAKVSGDAESAWIVLDYFDVMVHVFLPDARAYYDLESLWK